MVRMRINQFQAAPAAAGPLAPMPAHVVGHLIFRHQNLRVRVQRLRHGQSDLFAIVRKFAAVIADRIPAVQIRVMREQVGRVVRHHHVTVRCDGDARERERDAGRELPAGEVHGVRAQIIKLDVLIVVALADGVVHQFVDRDVADQDGAVVRAGSARGERVKIIRAIRPAAERYSIGLRAKLHRVEHAAAIGLEQIKGPARAAQSKTQLRLRERNKSCRWNHSVGRDDKFVGPDGIGQDAAGNIRGVRAVIVEFDELRHRGIFRVRQDFVDDHIAQRTGRERLHISRRAADGIAEVPRARVAFAVSRIGEHDGVSGAARRDGPGKCFRIRHGQKHEAKFVEKLQRLGFFQAA